MSERTTSHRWSDQFKDMTHEMERVSEIANNIGQAFARSLSQAIDKGSRFRTMIGQIGESLKRLALKQAFKPLESMMSGLVSSVYNAARPGGVEVTAFARGGVIRRPGYFPHSGGLGVAGEAGPEAILPLTRSSSGKLGVAASGSNPIQISMTVHTNDAASFKRAEADIGATLLHAVKRGQRAS